VPHDENLCLVVQFVYSLANSGLSMEKKSQRWMVREIHQQLNFQKFVDMACSMIEIITG
jgi:hypothetical protein